MCPYLITKLFANKQGHFFFVIYHKGFCYYNVVCQNILWLIKEQMYILKLQPRFESRLAEVGDIANVSKRLSILSLNFFLYVRMHELTGSLKGSKITQLSVFNKVNWWLSWFRHDIKMIMCRNTKHYRSLALSLRKLLAFFHTCCYHIKYTFSTAFC